MNEDKARAFLRHVDEFIPREIGDRVVSTDRVIVPTQQDAVVMQFYTKDGDISAFVTASGRELDRMNPRELAQRRVSVALERAMNG